LQKKNALTHSKHFTAQEIAFSSPIFSRIASPFSKTFFTLEAKLLRFYRLRQSTLQANSKTTKIAGGDFGFVDTNFAPGRPKGSREAPRFDL